MPPPPEGANVKVESREGDGHGLAVLLGETWGEAVVDGVTLVLLDIDGEDELETIGVEEVQIVEETVGMRGEGEVSVELEGDSEDVDVTLGLEVSDGVTVRVKGAVNEGFEGVTVKREVGVVTSEVLGVTLALVAEEDDGEVEEE